jgi:hypothetical protein
MLRLRMSGGKPPPHLYALIAWAGKTLLYSFISYMKAYFALHFVILNILKLNTKKVKFALQAIKAQKEMYTSPLSLTSAIQGGWGG